MSKYRKWVLTLGMMAAAPAVATAGPFDIFDKSSSQTSAVSTERSNQEVAEQIAHAFKQAQLSGLDLSIHYQNGTAQLSGQIQDAKQRTLASKVCMQVPGVNNVDNQLVVIKKDGLMKKPGFLGGEKSQIQQVSGTASNIASNQETAQKIASALTKSGLQAYDIEVRYQDGTALLSGTVPSAQEAQMAQAVASRVPGVRGVSNQLRPAGAPQQTAMAGPRGPRGPVRPVGFQGQMPIVPPAGQAPPTASGAVFNGPNLPNHAWPAQAAYPNYAGIQYPKEYSASAFPYIGPFYPYPQVPLGWRKVSLEWDDGFWKLDFDSKTDRWYWFMHPKNW